MIVKPIFHKPESYDSKQRLGWIQLFIVRVMGLARYLCNVMSLWVGPTMKHQKLQFRKRVSVANRSEWPNGISKSMEGYRENEMRRRRRRPCMERKRDKSIFGKADRGVQMKFLTRLWPPARQTSPQLEYTSDNLCPRGQLNTDIVILMLLNATNPQTKQVAQMVFYQTYVPTVSPLRCSSHR